MKEIDRNKFLLKSEIYNKAMLNHYREMTQNGMTAENAEKSLKILAGKNYEPPVDKEIEKNKELLARMIMEKDFGMLKDLADKLNKEKGKVKSEVEKLRKSCIFDTKNYNETCMKILNKDNHMIKPIFENEEEFKKLSSYFKYETIKDPDTKKILGSLLDEKATIQELKKLGYIQQSELEKAFDNFCESITNPDCSLSYKYRMAIDYISELEKKFGLKNENK